MFFFKQWQIKRIIKKIKSLHAHRADKQPSTEELNKEIAYYYDLIALYKKLIGTKKVPFAQLTCIECYRVAASLDDAEANYQLGHIALEEAKYREHLEEEGALKNDMNLKKCKHLYEEAHAYLSTAIGLRHIGAKRLRGLALINGWGLDIDKKSGFELVVASIDEENAWDRVPQIFTALGLNKPEFFSEIMQRKKH